MRACKCAYTCVCMLPMHNRCPYPHLVAMFECKYLHVSDRVEKRHKRFGLETVVWLPGVGPLLSSSLSSLIWDAGVVTVLTDQSVHESAGEGGLWRPEGRASEAVLLLRTWDFPASPPSCPVGDDSQLPSSCSGPTCRPHTSHPPRKSGVALSLKWTVAHMDLRAGSPDSALAYSVTFGEHLLPSCPQLPHLTALGIYSFFVSQSTFGTGRERGTERVRRQAEVWQGGLLTPKWA